MSDVAIVASLVFGGAVGASIVVQFAFEIRARITRS